MSTRKIAIPATNQKLADHFGDCHQIYIYKVDDSNIITKLEINTSKNQAEKISTLIYQNGVDVVITSSIDQQSIDALSGLGITVLTGAKPDSTDLIINDYLQGKLNKAYQFPMS